ncbi:hypothetical protein V8E36_009879 [Tilletia maclaganii]
MSLDERTIHQVELSQIDTILPPADMKSLCLCQDTHSRTDPSTTAGSREGLPTYTTSRRASFDDNIDT